VALLLLQDFAACFLKTMLTGKTMMIVMEIMMRCMKQISLSMILRINCGQN